LTLANIRDIVLLNVSKQRHDEVLILLLVIFRLHLQLILKHMQLVYDYSISCKWRNSFSVL